MKPTIFEIGTIIIMLTLVFGTCYALFHLKSTKLDGIKNPRLASLVIIGIGTICTAMIYSHILITVGAIFLGLFLGFLLVLAMNEAEDREAVDGG